MRSFWIPVQLLVICLFVRGNSGARPTTATATALQFTEPTTRLQPADRVARLKALTFSALDQTIAANPVAQDANNSKRTQIIPPDSGYVGSSSCRECHAKFYQLWAPSHHGLAMQRYGLGFARTNLVAPAAPITIGKTTYQMAIDRGVLLERRTSDEKEHSIDFVMGGKNVFYFLSPQKRGRLQVLPVAYDVRRREWFDMAGSAVRHFASGSDSPLDWRDASFTFNTSCFNCHVSQLTNNYDLDTDTYQTRWTEPGINCETCHGPGIRHVQAARALRKGEPLRESKLIVTDNFNQEQINSLCSSCHAKMYPITQSFLPGERFLDHFGLVGLESSDFYPDGRDLGENFTETSWRLSRCVASGKLNCTHCHTSSGGYRFSDSQANNACLPCHQRQVADAAKHSHHQAGTEGSRCVSCHMAVTEFARMCRSDHSMRPPTPATSLVYGSPNACNLCHTDKNAAWSDGWVRQWQTSDYQAPELKAAALVAAARKQDWSVLTNINRYLTSPDRGEIWAASLIQLLRICSDSRKWPGILASLKDPSPLVRAAAIDACGDELRADMLEPIAAASRDSYRLVRIRAAAALAQVPLESFSSSDEISLKAATSELKASFQARTDDPVSHYNLGNFFMERREFDNAVAAFETANKLQPNSIPPLVNASLAYSARGANDKAEHCLMRALSLNPTNAVVNLNLGMLLAEMGRPADAEKAFRTAFASDSRSAAAAYNLSVLLAKDRPQEALDWSRRAAALSPKDSKYSYSLAYFLAGSDKREEAIQVLERLMVQASPDSDAYVLLAQLYQQSNKKDEAVRVLRKAAGDARLTDVERQQFEAQALRVSEK